MENYAHDKMDDLLVKYLADEATPPEQKLVEEWINANRNNRDHFQQLQLIWSESENVAVNHPVDENKAWQRFQRKIKRERQQKALPAMSAWWKAAAVVLLLAGSGWLINGLIRNERADAAIVSISSVNEVKKDTLPDGSVATLNKRSELTYSRKFKGRTRNVKLKGEAFFDVQPDREKPFIIDVNNVQVKVVGTSFNVKSVGGATEVIVQTGIVEVTKGDQTIRLTAGERVAFETIDTTVTKETSGDQLYNYYVSKTFVCDNTPLWKLVEKLNEAYDSNIRIGRPELRKLPLTVTFNDESLDVILDIISQTFMIKVSRNEKEIVLE